MTAEDKPEAKTSKRRPARAAAPEAKPEKKAAAKKRTAPKKAGKPLPAEAAAPEKKPRKAKPAEGPSAPPPLATPEARALAEGRHADPFAVLGPHPVAGGWLIRVFEPGAERLQALAPESGEVLLNLTPHPEAPGLFEGFWPQAGRPAYRLRAERGPEGGPEGGEELMELRGRLSLRASAGRMGRAFFLRRRPLAALGGLGRAPDRT